MSAETSIAVTNDDTGTGSSQSNVSDKIVMWQKKIDESKSAIKMNSVKVLSSDVKLVSSVQQEASVQGATMQNVSNVTKFINVPEKVLSISDDTSKDESHFSEAWNREALPSDKLFDAGMYDWKNGKNSRGRNALEKSDDDILSMDIDDMSDSDENVGGSGSDDDNNFSACMGSPSLGYSSDINNTSSHSIRSPMSNASILINSSMVHDTVEMTTLEVCKLFTPQLIESLPMRDAFFIALLHQKKLLPGDLKDQIHSKTTKANAAAHFLDNAILNSFDDQPFQELLLVMEQFDSIHLNNLATKIKERLGAKFVTVNEDVIDAADVLRKRYKQPRYNHSTNDWPLYQPEIFTPLLIVHHKGNCTESEIETVAQSMNVKLKIGESIKIFNLFQKLKAPYMILIEGAPGIGKTVLSKEIALQWANNCILENKMMLFVLFMRDPHVKEITNTQMLVKYFFESEVISKKVADWLVTTDGNYLTIVVDGYDEVFHDCQCHSMIDRVIKGQVLSQCDIIITSRPVASSHLHGKVDCRLEVLGFTDKNRQEFIENALSGQSSKINDLIALLNSKPVLNSLCYIPLNMSILISLANEGVSTLPESQTVLYQNFIILTIVHFLKRNGSIPSTANITSLNDLQNPYNQICKELSQFAFLALQKDQLVFTLSEIKESSPNLTPANWHELGLLKSAQYFKVFAHQSFHFLHYSIQEYLAAYYISSLPEDKLLQLLNSTFWDPHYFNTWVMYAGITRGKHAAFLHFLSGKHVYKRMLIRSSSLKISSKILGNKIKCLHLLHCLSEADHKLLPSVKSIFKDNIIDFRNQILTSNDVRTLAKLLLQSPNKKWKKLDLSGCSIDDKSCSVLCEILLSESKSISIEAVDISYNNFHWKSLCRLCKVFKNWQTKQLTLCIDAFYCSRTVKHMDEYRKKLTKCVTCTRECFNAKSCNVLQFTCMPKRREIFVVYSEPHLVKCFQPHEYDSTDMLEEVNAFLLNSGKVVGNIIYTALLEDYTVKNILDVSDDFKGVKICGSYLHSKGVYQLSGLQRIECTYASVCELVADYITAIVYYGNNRLNSYLHTISATHINEVKNTLKKNISSLTVFDISNANITNEVCNDIAEILKNNNKLQQLYLSWNNLGTNGFTKIAKALQTSSLTVFCADNINIGNEAVDCISDVLSHNTKLQKVYLDQCNLQPTDVHKISSALKDVRTLTEISIKHTGVNDEAAVYLASVLSHNNKLKELYIGGNNLQASGAITIFKALNNATSITKLDIEKNNISDEAANEISEFLSHSSKLRCLNLGGNTIQATGAIAIVQGLQNTSNLTVLNIDYMNLDSVLDTIAIALSKNVYLKMLSLKQSNLRTRGAIMIATAICNISTLILLNISGNNIGEEAADEIATVISRNTGLRELYLGGNNFQAKGAGKIARALATNTILEIFVVNYNNINEEAADEIAAVISHNAQQLQKLYVGGNHLLSNGTTIIARSLIKCTNLKQLDIKNNYASMAAADSIADALSMNVNLQKLYLGGNKLQTTGTIKVAKALQKVNTLKKIDLEDNNIGAEAADDLAYVLSHNNELQRLYLRDNNLHASGAIKIAKGLENAFKLTVFDLSNNNIGSEAADDIATVLSHNSMLQELCLSKNRLETAGAIKIAKVLKKTFLLKKISFESNGIGSEAADEIADVVSHNINLQVLSLGNNKLQTVGSIKILRALHNVFGLIILNIEHNSINSEAADDIAALLSQNSNLEEFYAGGNNLQALKKIAQAIQNCQNLKKYDI